MSTASEQAIEIVTLHAPAWNNWLGRGAVIAHRKNQAQWQKHLQSAPWGTLSTSDCSTFRSSNSPPTRHAQDRFGDWYERQGSDQHKTLSGQFFTPRPLCDLMLGLLYAISPNFATDSADSKISSPVQPIPQAPTILDPGCGSGAFLIRAFDLFHHQGVEPSGILSSLYGLDLDPQAAALCGAQLWNLGQQTPHSSSPRAPESEQQIQVHPADFLKDDPATYFEKAKRASPDWIVANPPYIRQETYQTDISPQLRQWITAHYFGSIDTLDTYALFLMQATRLLPSGGKLAFVTSNSWRHTQSGQQLMQFIRQHYDVRLILSSQAERWFPQVAIHTAVLLCERRDTTCHITDVPMDYGQFSCYGYTPQNPPGEECLPEAVLTEPLSQLLPLNNMNDPTQYWQQVHALAAHLLQSVSSFNLASSNMDTGFSTPELAAHVTRAKMGACSNLSAERICISGKQNRWTDPIDPKHWCRLSDIGQVDYALKTGINAFFYVSLDRIQEFGIEPQWLRPIVKSLKSVQGYVVDLKQIPQKVFVCSLDKANLKAQGHEGALKYIEWGETQLAPTRQKRGQPVRWPEVVSVRGRTHWHRLPAIKSYQLLCSRFFDHRFVFPFSTTPVLIDQTFYGLTLYPHLVENIPTKLNTSSHTIINSETNLLFVAALLNSTLTYAQAEHTGQHNLGDGVLQFARHTMANLPLPHPGLFSPSQRQALADCFQALCQRPLLTIQEEFQQSDRHVLDEIVLDALLPGRPPHMRRAVYESAQEEILASVTRRKSLAGQMHRQKT